jgi:hypothetical protein
MIEGKRLQKSDLLQIIVFIFIFVFFIFGFHLLSWVWEIRLPIAISITLGILSWILIANRPTTNKVLPLSDNRAAREEPKKEDSGSDQSPAIILSGIYAVVAGLALGTAFSKTDLPIAAIGATVTSVDVANRILYLLAYLAIALPFYHGATVAFINQAKKVMSQEQGKKVFFDFIILFIESGILYFMAANLNSFLDFVVWSLALIITDSIWVSVSLITRDPIAPRQWLQLNITFSLFLAPLILIAIAKNPVELPTSYALPALMVVALYRTVVDYRTTWRMYFPSKRFSSESNERISRQ